MKKKGRMFHSIKGIPKVRRYQIDEASELERFEPGVEEQEEDWPFSFKVEVDRFPSFVDGLPHKGWRTG